MKKHRHVPVPAKRDRHLASTEPDALVRENANSGSDSVLADDHAWIAVRNLSVCVRQTDAGVVVDIYLKGREMAAAIASTDAFSPALQRTQCGASVADAERDDETAVREKEARPDAAAPLRPAAETETSFSIILTRHDGATLARCTLRRHRISMAMQRIMDAPSLAAAGFRSDIDDRTLEHLGELLEDEIQEEHFSSALVAACEELALERVVTNSDIQEKRELAPQRVEDGGDV